MRLKGDNRANRQARLLRRNLSLPETILWQHLRRSALGSRVRHQYPAGHYILDFYCAPARLAIEVDGGAHDYGDRPERDAARDRWLAAQGVRVVRVRASDVLGNLEGVLIHLRGLIDAATPSTTHSAVMKQARHAPGMAEDCRGQSSPVHSPSPGKSGGGISHSSPASAGEVAVRRTDGGGAWGVSTALLLR